MDFLIKGSCKMGYSNHFGPQNTILVGKIKHGLQVVGNRFSTPGEYAIIPSMNNYYHKNCQEYFDKTFSIDPAGFLSGFTRHLALGARILDVGCGSGRDMLWLKRQGFEPTGFEHSPGLAVLAEKETGCPVIQGDFTIYDFSSLAVDGILASGALVHLDRDQLVPVLENILKALNPGGHVYLSLKQGRGRRTDDQGREFTLWQDQNLRPIFKQLGLEVAAYSTNTSAMATGEVWLGYVLTIQ